MNARDDLFVALSCLALLSGCEILGGIEERTREASGGGGAGGSPVGTGGSGGDAAGGGGGEPAPVVELAAGHDHTCARLADGAVACWGDNARGQLGHPSLPQSSLPVVVTGLTGIKQIVAGIHHTCAVDADDAVLCWGSDEDGQLGRGQLVGSSATPLPVVGLGPIASLALAASSHQCAITKPGGELWCWGRNDEGAVGPGPADVTTPVKVAGLPADPVTDASTGCSHTCAIQSGVVRCWGLNDFGQLGVGSLGGGGVSPQVVDFPAGSVPERVALGCTHGCARVEGGDVYCWGNNDFGFLAVDAATTLLTEPQLPAQGLSAVEDLRPEAWLSCARRSDGEVRCWGYAAHGGLGNGSTSVTSSDVAVGVLDGAGTLAADVLATGWHHACAVAMDGRVLCWGKNDLGQLGIGSNVDQGLPVVVGL